MVLSYTTLITRKFDDTSSTLMKIEPENIGNVTFFDDSVFIFPVIALEYVGSGIPSIESNSKLDYEKIKNYFQIQIVVKTKRKGKSSRYFRSDFIGCKIEQF